MSVTKWWKIAGVNSIAERSRLHTCIEGRYITVFRNNGKLSAIDSVCHHAGGPLTVGPLRDIEDLGLTTVSCPWHNFLVCIDKGVKVFQSIELINGAPKPAGWKVGKVVQRVHLVKEDADGLFVSLNEDEAEISSDADSFNARCGAQFPQHAHTPEEMS